jgi:DNA polymerase III alpha subunit
MFIDKFGIVVFNEKDVFDALYTNNALNFEELLVDDDTIVEQFNQQVLKNADSIKLLNAYQEPKDDIRKFDETNQKNWFVPKEYQSFDIGNWLLDQCKTSEQKNRVIKELELFVQYDMIDVLICVKYLVDFMRTNNIVWGLGRGSSVASYCLYLIGIHKIDSLKFSLDIKEFLKGEKDD